MARRGRTSEHRSAQAPHGQLITSSSLPATRADVIVVGGGSCGSVVASRLSENSARTVVLLEAGPGFTSATDCPSEILDAAVLPVGPASPWIGTYPAELMPGIPRAIARGRVLGGSGAINGGYFIRARRSDFDAWPKSWSFDEVLPYFLASEADADFGGPWHGVDGPIPVHRIGPDTCHPITNAFGEAASRMGFAEDPDKNQPFSHGGIGPVPSNIRDGVRVNAAAAYLLPNLDRKNLVVQTDSKVHRVVVKDGRVSGVRVVIDGVEQLIEADTVVLCAGAVLTPQLLMLSGIGPAGALRAAGISVEVDSPNVGQGFTDHPEVGVSYRLRDDAPTRPPTAAIEAVLHVADLEIRPYTVPFDRLIPQLPVGDPMVGVGLMVPRSRGSMSLASADPVDPPLVRYRYLEADADRAALSEGVDIARELLSSSSMAGSVAEVDRHRDLLRRLGTSLHLSGSCAMGLHEETVLDDRCRVRGVDGLVVADTSAIPMVPSRGPHATAIMLAERVSTLIGR